MDLSRFPDGPPPEREARRLRILLVVTVEHASGSALRFRGIAGALARRGHDVHLVEPVPFGITPETPPNVTRHRLVKGSSAPEFQAPRWAASFCSVVRRVAPHVTYVLKGLPHGLAAGAFAQLRGSRLTMDFDDLDFGYYDSGWRRSLVRNFFERSARFASVTYHNEHMRSKLVELRGHERELTFVEQGVDVERFSGGSDSKDSVRERLGLGSAPVLLYTAHLGPASDLHEVLPSLARVAEARPDARLVVVGDGRRRAALEELAARCLPAGWCRFAGPVAHAEIPSYYAAADIALAYLSSGGANDFRASIKVREALAARLPVVASRAADHERFADFVRLTPADPGSFSEEVVSELSNPDREAATRGANWLARHATHDVAIEGLARSWEESA